METDVSVAASPSGAAEWRYGLGIGQQNRGERKPVLRFERVRFRGQLVRSRPGEADTRDPLRMTETLVEQISENKGSRPQVGNFAVGRVYRRGGAGFLKRSVDGFNNAAAERPFFLLTDLDRAEYPASLRSAWLSKPQRPNMLYGVAVVEVESWLLADRDALASSPQESPSPLPAFEVPRPWLDPFAHPPPCRALCRVRASRGTPHPASRRPSPCSRGARGSHACPAGSEPPEPASSARRGTRQRSGVQLRRRADPDLAGPECSRVAGLTRRRDQEIPSLRIARPEDLKGGGIE